jgi:hypothetical protein
MNPFKILQVIGNGTFTPLFGDSVKSVLMSFDDHHHLFPPLDDFQAPEGW